MRVALSSLLLILALGLSQSEGKVHKKEVKHVKGTTKSTLKPGDSAKMEDEAGAAVLKLLDAKIGKKVEDAAAEVQRFLTEALGKHIKETTKNMLDKTKHHSKQEKEHAGKAVLVNFKLPYVVTPVHVKKVKHEKKKPAHKKQPKHAPKHKAKPLQKDAKKPAPPAPHPPKPQPPQHPYPGLRPPVHHAAPMAPVAYPDMTPCQGTCTAPCTPGCYAPDCCCCPQAALPPPPPPPPPPPVYYPPPQTQVAVPAPPAPYCHPICTYRCAIFCPKHCCKLTGKRSDVEHSMEKGEDISDTDGEENEKEAEENMEEHEASGSAEEDEDPVMNNSR